MMTKAERYQNVELIFGGYQEKHLDAVEFTTTRLAKNGIEMVVCDCSLCMSVKRQAAGDCRWNFKRIGSSCGDPDCKSHGTDATAAGESVPVVVN
jgi:hypothetical protein